MGTIWRCFECVDYSWSLHIRVNRTNWAICHDICNPLWAQFLHTICCAFFIKCRIHVQHWFISNVRGGADKSLARPTSRCCRMESTVSLERVVCSCAELQVFSCYRGCKKACHVTHAISTTWRCELSSNFSCCKERRQRKITPFWKKHYENIHHHMPPSKTGWPSRLSNFWNFFDAIQMISCCHWWPWTKPGYNTITRTQSKNHWSGGIAAHLASKNSKCKNPLEKLSPQFFGIKMASSSLIIFQRTKLSTRSITHLCWCNWRTFWRKNGVGRSPRESCSCTTMLCLTRHLQPRRNWPIWASNVLITHPILWIWPRWTTTCSLDWKNNWKVAIFRPTWRSLLLWRPGCTDNLLNFFWVACKS